jgi:hypothetical protein
MRPEPVDPNRRFTPEEIEEQARVISMALAQRALKNGK